MPVLYDHNTQESDIVRQLHLAWNIISQLADSNFIKNNGDPEVCAFMDRYERWLDRQEELFWKPETTQE